MVQYEKKRSEYHNTRNIIKNHHSLNRSNLGTKLPLADTISRISITFIIAELPIY